MRPFCNTLPVGSRSRLRSYRVYRLYDIIVDYILQLLFKLLELCAIPTNISWVADCPESSVFFNWNEFVSHCDSPTAWYFITTSNCGSCPTTTTHNTVNNITCTDAPSDGSPCNITIQAEVHENIISRPQQLSIQTDCPLIVVNGMTYNMTFH